MEQLDFWVAAEIVRFLPGRRDAIAWSLCSRWLHTLLVELCHLRLTEQQTEVVRKILALQPQVWQAHVQKGVTRWNDPQEYNRLNFPEAFTIASAPSTGKTLMALYTAAFLQRQGKPCFLSAPLKLCRQWQGEARKFAERLKIPPLCIVHPRYDGNWPQLLQQGYLPLVPDSVFKTKTLRLSESVVVDTRDAFLRHSSWEVGFVDEACSIVSSLQHYTRRCKAEQRPFHMVSFNASRGGSDVLVSYAKDAALGSLPFVETIVEQTASSQAALAKMPAKNREFAFFPKVNTADLTAFIDRYRGPKTILLSNSTDILRKPKAKKHRREFEQVNSLAMPQVKEALAERGFLNICDLDTDNRSRVMEEFAALREGALAAPLDYILRGWNLKCSTVLVADAGGRLAIGSLIQLLGRARRAESPFNPVQLCILQNCPIGARQLAFHALAASSSRATDDLIREAEWFAKGPVMIKGENGKRRKLDEDLVNDKSLNARLALFSSIFPDDVKFIREVSPTKLVVDSRL